MTNALAKPAIRQPDPGFSLSRRSLLRNLFLGLGAAGMPTWVKVARADACGTELCIPTGPLANIPPVEKKTLTSGTVGTIDDQVYAPPGFDVRCVARAGVVPAGTPSGYAWHVNPDGGAVYPSPADGGWVYVSNSETTPGGVGALRFDAGGNLVDAYRILNGTRNNCAGGSTPWGTWLSCEETSGGFVYECDPFGTPADAVQRPALGAFPHEACAIDPIHHVCYQTEDGGDQRFYRFRSNPGDLSDTPGGVTRMNFTDGVLEVLKIDDFAHNVDPTDAELRLPRKVSWVTKAQVQQNPPLPFPTVLAGTRFNGGEGLWYYEIPEELRTTPPGGTAPTRGVMFFATKGTNRIYAYDIENELIETIFDNSMLDPDFNDVDNVVVSPAGDVIVAEDGDLMRLYVIVPNQGAKLLMQITRGGSEITGPAFTPDGSRLYFSSQRGPSGASGTGSSGATFEMLIPPEYRSLAPGVPDPFSFVERTGLATGAMVTSEAVTVQGFTGALEVSLSGPGEYSINGGGFSSGINGISAGQTLRVRHRGANTANTQTVTTVSVGAFSTPFRSVTSVADRSPDPFDFGSRSGVEPESVVESDIITLTGYNTDLPIQAGPGAEYTLDGTNWTSANGTLGVGQQVQMRHVADPRPLRYTKTYLRIGDGRGYFTTRTA